MNSNFSYASLNNRDKNYSLKGESFDSSSEMKFIIFLFFLVHLAYGLKCNVATFTEIDNQMDFNSSDPVDCTGLCFSRYMNDGWYTVYELGCDSNKKYCTKTGCTDDIGSSTKICCCNDADNCVHPNASVRS